MKFQLGQRMEDQGMKSEVEMEVVRGQVIILEAQGEAPRMPSGGEHCSIPKGILS